MSPDLTISALIRSRSTLPAVAEELLNSRNPLKGFYLVHSRRQPVQPLGKRALDPQMGKGAALILIFLLSLGLWVAIRVVVGSFASALVG